MSVAEQYLALGYSGKAAVFNAMAKKHLEKAMKKDDVASRIADATYLFTIGQQDK